LTKYIWTGEYIQSVNQKQLENVEYFNYLVSMMTNDARRIHAIKSRISMAKEAVHSKKILLTRNLDLNSRKSYLIATFGAQHCMVLKLRHFGK
jgi:hypothetical protein